MNRQARVTVTGMVALVLALTALSVVTAQGALQLSETMADPASDWNSDGEVHFRDDEYVEVTNTGPDPVDLHEYFVRDALGDDAHLNLFGVLNAGEVAVFYGHHAVAWQQEVGLAATGLSLNNGGDTVELWQGDPNLPASQMVDVLIYEDHEADDDRASGRLHLNGDWALFDGLNPYDGTTEPLSTMCDPSPGVLNDCQPLVPAEIVSWGELKTTYR
ncbi:MAG: lamin tail domain-containing protein [bacterium]